MSISLWSSRAAAADLNWKSVAFGNGLFVAVSSNGSAMTSPDGITWTSRTAAANNLWSSVTYGNGLFVAVSTSGSKRVMTSPDGITWTSRTAASNISWQSVTYGNGKFVAVSSDGASRVMISSNGISWTSKLASGNNRWQSITYGNGLFVAVAYGTSNVMTSPNGIDWTSRTPAANNDWVAVTYGNGLFVAVAASGTENRVMTSPDGITWTARTSASDQNWMCVAYGNGTYVATTSSGSGNRVMTSLDGFTWSLGTSDAVCGNGVCYGNNVFVVVNTGTLVWTATTVLPTITNFSVPTKTDGDPSFAITEPTSNGSGAFSYTSSNLSVATIEGNIVTIVGPGDAVITATQAATEEYGEGTATTTFQVLQSPTITNFSVPTKTYGDPPFAITEPTSNSSGAFSYTSSNLSVATIEGNIVTIVGIGSSTITATQAATEEYGEGTATTTFQVLQSPTITNFSVPTKTYGDPPFAITEPTSNSSGAFSYTSSNLSVATIEGNIVTIAGIGSSIITATQAATEEYGEGTATTTFQVLQSPTITNFSIPNKTYGDSLFEITEPTSNSSGAFSYTSSNLSVATIEGIIVTIVGPGDAVITATQAATEEYGEGTATTTFHVSQSTPTNPAVLTTGDELLYFMGTTSTYGSLDNAVEVGENITAANYKVLTSTNNNAIITIINNNG